MVAKQQTILDKLLRFLSSLECGLVLLGSLGTAVIIGTMILQRPMTQEGQIEQVYAPQTVRLLNALGLFDVFHTWWFILLLGLLGANITLASLERFPQVWRLFSRPHTLADEWYVRQLPLRKEIPLGFHSPAEALAIAKSRLNELGYAPKPKSLEKGTLYVEKHRTARLAPYIVHASLLIIFAGAIIDGLWGFKGFVNLTPGARTQSVEAMTTGGAPHDLGFTLRCDGVGMERYTDGSPKQYWSLLAVEDNGREVMRKTIYVNDPLTYQGVRFFQASYGPTGTPHQLVFDASGTGQDGKQHPAQQISLQPGKPAHLDDSGATVELTEFVPDFVLDGNQISSRSDEPRNPAIQLGVTSASGKHTELWVFPKAPEMAPPNPSGINFQLRGLEMEYMTGLQVAHQPGQNLIWGGCLLLTAGLMMALYMSHVRIWGVVGRDRKGQLALLLGGQPSKYRESFERRFNELTGELEIALSTAQAEVGEALSA
ncbi:MAG: cytochrome c biogenesis protein ResB [Terriglobia bacterium]|jgi:cytochrome c biogenesis protein